MDDMEKKEDLEQEVTETVAEEIEEATETVSEAEAAEDISAEAETAEETVAEETTEDVPTEEVPVKQEKGGSNIIGIIVGLALFVAFLAVVWMAPVGNSVKDTGVFYAKDNDLYFYDMKNEPYLVQEGISAGGGYNYFYSGWGAGVAEDGDAAYYMANIDESGAADLYRKDVNSAAEAELIDSNVYDYKASKNGEVVAYLAMENDSLQLKMDCGNGSEKIAEGIHLEDDVYALRGDGKWVVFKDAYNMLCAAEVQKDGNVHVRELTDECPLYALAEDTLYFVSKADDMYNIYSYDFKNEPELVAENAQYMELMPNGRDLLYGTKSTEIIPYSELLEDDMAEIDAAMKEDDPNYDQKLMRDDLRAAMASGEGLEPLLQEFYILSNGKATLVADNVVSAVAVKDSDKNFVTGYKAKPFQPLYLSVIGGGLEMVDMIYYMSINYGGMQPFLADATGNVEILTGAGVLPDTLKVSADGTKAAYLMTNENTGGNILMQMEIGKAADAGAVQMDVKEFDFVGRHDLFYYYEYADGAGTLAKAGEGDNSISAASGVHFAKDTGRVYYLLLDQNTGHGKMEWWDGENRETIDGGIFAFQYKGNGKAAIIYDYDLMNQTGDLGYYDGKGVTMLDEDMTAIFIN
ncbi:hypothetical protein [Anaerotignum sp.]